MPVAYGAAVYVALHPSDPLSREDPAPVAEELEDRGLKVFREEGELEWPLLAYWNREIEDPGEFSELRREVEEKSREAEDLLSGCERLEGLSGFSGRIWYVVGREVEGGGEPDAEMLSCSVYHADLGEQGLRPPGRVLSRFVVAGPLEESVEAAVGYLLMIERERARLESVSGRVRSLLQEAFMRAEESVRAASEVRSGAKRPSEVERTVREVEELVLRLSKLESMVSLSASNLRSVCRLFRGRLPQLIVAEAAEGWAREALEVAQSAREGLRSALEDARAEVDRAWEESLRRFSVVLGLATGFGLLAESLGLMAEHGMPGLLSEEALGWLLTASSGVLMVLALLMVGVALKIRGSGKKVPRVAGEEVAFEALEEVT